MAISQHKHAYQPGPGQDKESGGDGDGPHDVPPNQTELVVHCDHQGSISRLVAARQPSSRRGRYWIFFSLGLMMRTRPVYVGGGEASRRPAAPVRPRPRCLA